MNNASSFYYQNSGYNFNFVQNEVDAEELYLQTELLDQNSDPFYLNGCQESDTQLEYNLNTLQQQNFNQGYTSQEQDQKQQEINDIQVILNTKERNAQNQNKCDQQHNNKQSIEQLNYDCQNVNHNEQSNIIQDQQNQNQQNFDECLRQESPQSQQFSAQEDETSCNDDNQNDLNIETIYIKDYDLSVLMEKFAKLKQNENKIYELKQNQYNQVDKFYNYFILFQYIAVDVINLQIIFDRISDLSFTINNYCLNYNVGLIIGSFSYSSQTNQIIYEIKYLKFQNINQIEKIILNAIKIFDMMVNQIIFSLQYKISNQKTTNFDQLYHKSGLKINNQNFNKKSRKSQFNSGEDQFSKSKLVEPNDYEHYLNLINNQNKVVEKELEKISQLLDQLSRENIEEISNTQQYVQKDNKQPKKNKRQVGKFNYFIDDLIAGLSDRDQVDQGGFHKIHRINVQTESKLYDLAVKNQSSYKLKKEIGFVVKFLQNSYCKYIAKIFVQDNKFNYYLLKYYHFKSLRDYLKKYQYVISLKTKLKMLKQIAKGIQHLHSYNILHLDIKPENILISKKGNVKICDFGEAYHHSYQQQRESIKFSVPYGAPEITKHKTDYLSKKADVFSFGTLAYELIFGRMSMAFITRENYIQLFQKLDLKLGTETDYLVSLGPRGIVFRLIILILKCLQPNMKNRPDIGSVVNFFTLLNNLFQPLKIKQEQFNDLFQRSDENKREDL